MHARGNGHLSYISPLHLGRPGQCLPAPREHFLHIALAFYSTSAGGACMHIRRAKNERGVKLRRAFHLGNDEISTQNRRNCGAKTRSNRSKYPTDQSVISSLTVSIEVCSQLSLTHFFFAAGTPAKTSNFRLMTEPDT